MAPRCYCWFRRGSSRAENRKRPLSEQRHITHKPARSHSCRTHPVFVIHDVTQHVVHIQNTSISVLQPVDLDPVVGVLEEEAVIRFNTIQVISRSITRTDELAAGDSFSHLISTPCGGGNDVGSRHSDAQSWTDMMMMVLKYFNPRLDAWQDPHMV